MLCPPPEILVEEVCGGARECAFPPSSQALLLLLAPDPTLRSDLPRLFFKALYFPAETSRGFALFHR